MSSNLQICEVWFHFWLILNKKVLITSKLLFSMIHSVGKVIAICCMRNVRSVLTYVAGVGLGM